MKITKKTALKVAIVLFVLTMILISVQVKENIDETNPRIIEIKKLISPVNPEISKMNFRKGSKSYTINKEIIYLCIYDENGNYYDNNMMIYVALHEVAHVLCKSIGHTDEFRSIFENLLNIAEKKGIYDPKSPLVNDYCNY